MQFVIGDAESKIPTSRTCRWDEWRKRRPAWLKNDGKFSLLALLVRRYIWWMPWMVIWGTIPLLAKSNWIMDDVVSCLSYDGNKNFTWRPTFKKIMPLANRNDIVSFHQIARHFWYNRNDLLFGLSARGVAFQLETPWSNYDQLEDQLWYDTMLCWKGISIFFLSLRVWYCTIAKVGTYYLRPIIREFLSKSNL